MIQEREHKYCQTDNLYHIAYFCTHCDGGVLTKWHPLKTNMRTFVQYSPKLKIYYPLKDGWKPKVNLSSIINKDVRKDFEEAISCYNNRFFNACMIMARRSIQQEMDYRQAKEGNLYEQIESMGISDELKKLLQKVKNFGNYGAHPDFYLFDNDGNRLDEEDNFAKLTLIFLDKYFSDQYEIDALVESAPKSKKEIDSKD